MPGLDQLFTQIGAFWRGLAGAQRVALLSTVLITAGAIALVVNLGQRSDYGTLYANLEPDDAATIVDELKTLQVPFELSHAGTAIQVPVERIYDLRLELAQKGLPASGPVGLEVFDDSPLGMTPFQQRVRFQRAMEGELGRSITRLAPVHWARVHINVPDRRVFRREQNAASASVVVSLVSGQTLSAGEARGIAQLISGAVDGLETGNVSILDASGRLLLRPKGNEEEALAAEAIDTQRGIESQLANRAQNLLDAALGSGKAVVTVSAKVDMRRVESKADLVNPDQAAVVSEQRSEETRTEPNLTAGGVPGAAANLPGGPGDGGGAGGTSSETITRETINFDFSRTTERTVVPMGAIQKLSVALLVDGTYSVPEGTEVAEGEEPPAPQYQPRSEDEMNQLSEIVKRAVGFDTERGDVIAAHNVPFRSPLEDLPTPEAPGFLERPEMLMLVSPIMRVVAVLGGLMLLVMMVIRPTMKQLASAAAIAAPGGTGALAAGGNATGALEGGEDEATDLSIPVGKADAKQVADAIRQWLRE